MSGKHKHSKGNGAFKTLAKVHKAFAGVSKTVVKVQKTGKKFHRDLYMQQFERELRHRGKPDEVSFLISMTPSESRGNPLAVSFLPAKGKHRDRWHCGPVQTQCKTLAECQKVQNDPQYAARKALDFLRAHDRFGGDRKCNWTYGPFHEKCRRIRAAMPSS